MSLNYQFRPLGAWTEGNTKNRRGAHTFKASWLSTLDLLERELGYLDAKHIVLQADFTESDLRNDGMPRANARQPQHPGVRVAFDSKHGPLTYATDAYERVYGFGLQGWQANVRAIALGLEALRAVDRYGVTKRGEQYTGWAALPPATAMGPGMSVAAAWDHLVAMAGLTPSEAADRKRTHVHRLARAAAHPDRNGGDREDWDLVEQAARALGLLS
ncbi:MAG: hypothetical protein JWM93_2451 [Frankiales bacterium]|nr:hypothetical protein [Frankiales bacterium]